MKKPFGAKIFSLLFVPVILEGYVNIYGNDITERKKAEEALKESEHLYRTVFDNSQDGFQLIELIYDENGKPYDHKFLRVNRAYEKIIGVKAKDITGKTARRISPNCESYWFEVPDRVAKTGKSEHVELYNRDINKTLDCYYFPYSKNVVGTLFRDITERKAMENEIKQTMEKLKQSNAELEQFAYVASHDLQEPLRMVASYVQLLERRYKGKLDPEADEFIAYAVDGANRMRGLIDDLLTYSRVSRLGKPFEPTNLESTLDIVLMNLQVSIADSGAVVTHDKLPVVMADGGQLVQLLQNLIGNAIKFHGKEPPRVHVSAQVKENEYLFSVRDNGIGIAPEYFDRLFKIFQRLHTREEYPGSGIGLAICKKIVESHGGRIWIESQVGKGSTIYFTLNKQKRSIKKNEKN